MFAACIQACTDYELLAQNLQIIDQKQTIGELDFLLWDKKENCALHLELAFKFYLLLPDNHPGLDRLVGLNGEDRLDLKLNKLNQRQFPNLFNPVISNTLKKLNIDPQQTKQELALYGFYFSQPFIQNQPAELNPNALGGGYLNLTELKNCLEKGMLFFTPPKKDWILAPDLNSQWVEIGAIQTLLENWKADARSFMLWIKHLDGSLERLIVRSI